MTVYNVIIFFQETNTSLYLFFSLLIFFGLITFYLDDFKLSENKFIKCIEIFSFIGILLIFLVIVLYNIESAHIVSYIKDDSVNLHGHVNVTRDAATEISKGISSVGSQIGSSAAIVGIAGAVGKSIAKSSIPPVQKAAVVVGGGLLGGLIHSGVTHVNRANALENVARNSNITKGSDSNISTLVNKLVDDSSISPLEGLLFSIQGISAICFTLTIILVIQLFVRLHVKKDINIGILGVTLNKYLNKLIVLNQKVSVVYI
jgi:hypothetical protein